MTRLWATGLTALAAAAWAAPSPPAAGMYTSAEVTSIIGHVNTLVAASLPRMLDALSFVPEDVRAAARVASFGAAGALDLSPEDEQTFLSAALPREPPKPRVAPDALTTVPAARAVALDLLLSRLFGSGVAYVEGLVRFVFSNIDGVAGVSRSSPFPFSAGGGEEDADPASQALVLELLARRLWPALVSPSSTTASAQPQSACREWAAEAVARGLPLLADRAQAGTIRAAANATARADNNQRGALLLISELPSLCDTEFVRDAGAELFRLGAWAALLQHGGKGGDGLGEGSMGVHPCLTGLAVSLGDGGGSSTAETNRTRRWMCGGGGGGAAAGVAVTPVPFSPTAHQQSAASAGGKASSGSNTGFVHGISCDGPRAQRESCRLVWMADSTEAGWAVPTGADLAGGDDAGPQTRSRKSTGEARGNMFLGGAAPPAGLAMPTLEEIDGGEL
jgi:hypothetical protein